MKIRNQKVIITTTHAKMEMAMEEKINKSRHQTVQEEITMEIKETIDHPITKGSFL